MSSVDTSITKQSLKALEIPINKFCEEVIPHHQASYEQHKSIVTKLVLLDNISQANREIKFKKPIVKQLKDLMYELDTLRTQVEDSELNKFDTKTLSLRKIILNLITEYTSLEKHVLLITNKDDGSESDENVNPFESVSQIQLNENVDELKLKQIQNRLNEVENIHRDIEAMNEIYTSLNGMVTSQGQHVDHVSEIVESTHTNVTAGVKHLEKAKGYRKLRTASYPLAGALMGLSVGGPIGLVAGAKIGCLVGAAGAIMGYTSGKIAKAVECVATQHDQDEDDDKDKKDV